MEHVRRLVSASCSFVLSLCLVGVTLGCSERPEAYFQSAPEIREVRSGVDVLQEAQFNQLKGRKIGLITNSSAVNVHGVRTVDLFAENLSQELKVLFSPEHGLSGLSEEKSIADSVDTSTQLRVYSLFGEVQRPTPGMLRGLDTIVFDIQDIGARFYTYISTMGYAMEESAKLGLKFIVLDRPNPITGSIIEGPLLDPSRISFTGYDVLPLRHGLTVGELANLFKHRKRLELDLEVISLRGWRRELWFDETGLPWRNTSPNIRSLRAALLYPGLGSFENTNVSVGRGTDTPFEMLGAPWMDGRRVASRLRERRIPGVSVVPRRFTPAENVFAGEECGGVEFIVTDRDRFSSVLLGMEVVSVLLEVHPQEWKAENFVWLFGNQEAFDAMLQGEKSAREVYKEMASAIALFKSESQAALIYD